MACASLSIRAPPNSHYACTGAALIVATSTRAPTPMVDSTPPPCAWVVDALARGRLGLVQGFDQRAQVAGQLVGVERTAADRRVDDAGLVDAELHRPALAFFTAVATSGVTVPTFGFGIRPRGPDLAQRTDDAHRVRARR